MGENTSLTDRPYAVLVLGAGASKEYGLPLGTELRGSISKLLAFEFDHFGRSSKGDPVLLQALQRKQPNFPQEVGEINRLITAGREIIAALPQAPSIDQFIFNRSGRDDIEAIGKLAIARALQIAERQSKITIWGSDQYSGPSKGFADWRTDDTWLPKLFSLLIDGCDGIEALEDRLQRLKVVSFNYDRVFRHYLYHSLTNYYPTQSNRIAKALSELEVIHPYGSLGALDWQNNGGGLRFGADLNGDSLNEIATGLLTFNESIADEVRAAARLAIENASIVMFLGFAFHEQNMAFLEAANTRAGRFFGTVFGVSAFDQGMIREEIVARFRCRTDAVFLHDGNCASMFSEYSRALRLVGI